MILFATWDDYLAHGNGKVPEEEFKSFAQEASHWMEYVTFGRAVAAKGEDRVVGCCVALVDYLYAADQFVVPEKGMITRESVKQWRIAYEIPSHLSPDKKQENMTNICQTWLVRPTNLMYNGI
jgi:hypothetical protein